MGDAFDLIPTDHLRRHGRRPPVDRVRAPHRALSRARPPLAVPDRSQSAGGHVRRLSKRRPSVSVHRPNRRRRRHGRLCAGRFGGMSFTGIEHGRLILFRVRDLQPEEQLSPARSHKMTLEPHLVSSIVVNGRPVWPAESLSPEVTRCQTMLTKARCWRPVCVNVSSSSGARSAPKPTT
jgi:hypothetical protein